MSTADSTSSADQRVVSPDRCDLPLLKPPLQRGERLVFEFFDQLLPAEWEIYLQPFLNGQRPDFVLLHPQVGVAVFEVKDWDLRAMSYEPAAGRDDAYLRVRDHDGKAHHKENPLAQTSRYRRDMVNLYVPALGTGNRIAAVTAGVIFTSADTDEVQELLAPAFDALPAAQRQYTPVSGIDRLRRRALDEVFPEARRQRSSYMSEEIARDLRQWLVEPEHSREQRRPLVLDRKQRELAEATTRPAYWKLRGPAGSGKSAVLAARAAKMSNEGREVLVVSYNHTLRTYLADLVVRAGGRRNALTWLGFHDWCKRTMGQAGRRGHYDEIASRLASGDKKPLEDEMAEATLSAVNDGVTSSAVPRYDAILVDEGQDFRPSWWAALRSVRREPGEMLLVADRAQDIYERNQYWTENAMTGSGLVGRWNELRVSYRMPPALTGLVRDFRERFLPLHDEILPEPRAQQELSFLRLRWCQADAQGSTAACLEEIAAVVAGGAFSDICVVTTTRDSVLAVVSALKNRNIECIHTVHADPKLERQMKHFFFRGDARVKVTTIHSFKGWEMPRLVVLLDDAAPALAYTALSRLSSGETGSALSVVCTVDAFAEYGATWPEHQDDRVLEP